MDNFSLVSLVLQEGEQALFGETNQLGNQLQLVLPHVVTFSVNVILYTLLMT